MVQHTHTEYVEVKIIGINRKKLEIPIRCQAHFQEAFFLELPKLLLEAHNLTVGDFLNFLLYNINSEVK